MSGRWKQRGLLLALCASLAGCRHKTPQPIVLPPSTPVPVTTPSTTSKIPSVPAPSSPVTPVRVPARKVPKSKRRVATAAPAVTPPPAVAATAPSPANQAMLNALTLGDDKTPQRGEAQQLIGSLRRRLADLPASTLQTEREQVDRVIHFRQEAERALQGGDAEGALSLATKAKLLLDDLTN